MPRVDCLEILNQLKFTAMSNSFDDIVTDGIRRKRSTLDILHRLLKAEQTERQIRAVQYRIYQARFPQYKTLTAFDFTKTELNKPAFELFLDNSFIQNNRNIIFVGGPGTGKTHLATTLGINAASAGLKVRFWNVLDLVNNLERDKEKEPFKIANQMLKQDLIPSRND